MSEPMSFREIAAELNCSVEAVRLTYLRAIEKIRRRPEMAKKLRELVEFRNKLRKGAE